HVTEVVLLQDQVEGLVPGNVLELDGDGALDVRIDDDVQPGEVRYRAKDVLDVGVPQVERDRLARELRLTLRECPRLEGGELPPGLRRLLLGQHSRGRLEEGVLPRRRLLRFARAGTAGFPDAGRQRRRRGLLDGRLRVLRARPDRGGGSGRRRGRRRHGRCGRRLGRGAWLRRGRQRRRRGCRYSARIRGRRAPLFLGR